MPFGLFQHQTATTRFEQSNELKAIALLTKQLRAKNVELARAAKQNGAGSKDQRKYDVVSPLVEQLDAAIDAFNREPAASEDPAKTRQIIALIKEMNTHVQRVLNDHSVTLKTPRNLDRKHVNMSVEYGLIGTALVPAVVMPLSFPAGVVAIAFAKLSGDGLRDLTGLNNLEPMTNRLINKLGAVLDDAEINLTVMLIKQESPEHALTLSPRPQ